MRSSANWILNDSGAAKSILVSQVFFKSCVERMHREDIRSVGYQIWMSSPFISKLAVNEPYEDLPISENMVLDFRGHFLRQIDSKIDLIAPFDRFESFENSRVFYEIEQQKRSQQVLKEAVDLVELWPSWMKSIFKFLVKNVVPVCTRNGEETGFSFTDPNFIGAIFASNDFKSPFPPISQTIAFSHELGHLVLMLYQHSGDLLLGTDKWVYSGVRKTSRPAIASFHACVALSYMIACCESLVNGLDKPIERAFVQANAEDFRLRLNDGLDALKLIPKNEIAEQIFQEMKQLSEKV